MPLVLEAARARDDYVAELLSAVSGGKGKRGRKGKDAALPKMTRKQVARGLPGLLRAAAKSRKT